MVHLPVIVGFGGINPAGRSSFYHAYRRMVIKQLQSKETMDVYLGLATMMGILEYKDGKYYDKNNIAYRNEDAFKKYSTYIEENTLLRKISPELFTIENMLYNKKIKAKITNQGKIEFQLSRKSLPSQVPVNWIINENTDNSRMVEVCINDDFEFLFKDRKEPLVNSGGQIPTGFNPGLLYRSAHHPRGLQLTIFGASDAIHSMGINWEEIKNTVSPDQIGVYSCSAMGQLDQYGNGGLSKAFPLGKKITSKQLALGLAEMPADFINAYILGNVGYTCANVGACATTLYNLNIAMDDIRSGKRKVALVGNSEAPILAEIIEGYRVTSALAEDSQLLEANSKSTLDYADYARSCRPFSNNFGFTLAESAQYFVLMADDLAIQLGAQVFGSLGDIFINADGYKKSIASPGFGNYICLAKAVASARAMFGMKSIRQHSYIHAHGTGTPQNRTTESHGLNEIAKAFGIEKWPVAAIKCYLGHSLGPASGDQLSTTLGTWRYGQIPGIFTLDDIADDVYHSNLLLSQENIEVIPDDIDVTFINSKGFGGNNATGAIISPQNTLKMLQYRYGEQQFNKYKIKNELVQEKAEEYNQKAIQGKYNPIYNFGKDVLGGNNLDLTDQYIQVPGFKEKIDLNLDSPYPEMGL